MEDLEFKKYRQMIEDQKVVADTYRNSFNSNLEPLNKAITTIVDNIDKRNNLLREYTDDVHSFESSNNLTKPSDIFLGVRTAAEMADPEELKNKTDKMKSDAAEIERLQSSIETNQAMIISSFKTVFAALREYLIQSNNIYDMSKDLLDKLDSIYDIAQIAKNS